MKIKMSMLVPVKSVPLFRIIIWRPKEARMGLQLLHLPACLLPF